MESELGPPPPIDTELAQTLEVMLPTLPKLEGVEAIPAVRESVQKWSPEDLDITLGGKYTVEDRPVPSPAGEPDISLLICRPVGSSSVTSAIYHTHGGGMVCGNNRTLVVPLLECSLDLGLTLVSVEYRLAPETRHPGPVGDCYAGLLWTAEHAGELGIDPRRIIIAGASAGGGLAAATALLARDRGGPHLAGQLLMCPMLDDRNDSPSAIQLEGVGVWDRRENQIGWTALLGEDCGSANVSHYAAPARAPSLAGLPPTFIDVGTVETFRGEAVTYASRIWQAGGDCELHVWPGGFHGYDSLAPQAAVSIDTKEVRTRWLRRLLKR